MKLTWNGLTPNFLGTCVVIIGSCICVTACGSNGKRASTVDSSSATLRGHLNACLEEKHLPRQPLSSDLPSGVTPSGYKAAVRKCMYGNSEGPVGETNFSPSIKAQMYRDVACLHRHGFDIPPPNFSGQGRVFDVAGIDTNGDKFKTAEEDCHVGLGGQ
jgi:hypothetical protein